MFVIGQEASQNGFGLRIPAMSVNRSTPGTVASVGRTWEMRAPPRPIASTMERAASFPAWTAFTTSAPPLTMSPIAQTFGFRVRPAPSVTATAPRTSAPSASSTAVGPAWPTARMIVSRWTSKRVPRMGSGCRRPDASGSPSRIRSKSAAHTVPSPQISTGAVSHSIRTPSWRTRSIAWG